MVSSVVATGRRMNGADRFIGRALCGAAPPPGLPRNQAPSRSKPR